mmetsp:Transcript_83822/g.186134  ORF Transcript_83822/g.186134 Transcript_83822/m.186134 type:complete len:212 (+) Transcript_83822:561-1196(+)
MPPMAPAGDCPGHGAKPGHKGGGGGEAAAEWHAGDLGVAAGPGGVLEPLAIPGSAMVAAKQSGVRNGLGSAAWSAAPCKGTNSGASTRSPGTLRGGESGTAWDGGGGGSAAPAHAPTPTAGGASGGGGGHGAGASKPGAPGASAIAAFSGTAGMPPPPFRIWIVNKGGGVADASRSTVAGSTAAASALKSNSRLYVGVCTTSGAAAAGTMA